MENPPAWGLGEVLTPPHPKNWSCYEAEFILYNTKKSVCTSQRKLFSFIRKTMLEAFQGKTIGLLSLLYGTQ